jgi:hypothetical protein
MAEPAEISPPTELPAGEAIHVRFDDGSNEPGGPSEATEHAGNAGPVKRQAPKLPSQIREQFLLPEPEPRWWQRKRR